MKMAPNVSYFNTETEYQEVTLLEFLKAPRINDSCVCMDKDRSFTPFESFCLSKYESSRERCGSDENLFDFGERKWNEKRGEAFVQPTMMNWFNQLLS